jgi:hypothetical protein
MRNYLIGKLRCPEYVNSEKDLIEITCTIVRTIEAYIYNIPYTMDKRNYKSYKIYVYKLYFYSIQALMEDLLEKRFIKMLEFKNPRDLQKNKKHIEYHKLYKDFLAETFNLCVDQYFSYFKKFEADDLYYLNVLMKKDF